MLSSLPPRPTPWLALFLSLPAKAGACRMRVWRELKVLGCATLRDGVYLLPDAPEHAQALDAVAAAVLAAKGVAELFQLNARDPAQDAALRALFDRSADYAELATALHTLYNGLPALGAAAAQRRLQALQRRYAQLGAVDHFAGEAQRQVGARLSEVRAVLMRQFHPGEPQAAPANPIARLNPSDYQGRIWATRARPWVDRLASAWLIRHRIDPQARIIWLTTPDDCKPDWLGFDFDGAAFSHVGAKVTFETLLTSFGLDAEAPLARMGALVHALDMGGLQVAEAPGIEALLAGLRASQPDDDSLLSEAMKVFNWLLQSFAVEPV